MTQRAPIASIVAVAVFSLAACSSVSESPPPVGGCTVEDYRASPAVVAGGSELTVSVESASCTESMELQEYTILLVSADGESRETYLIEAGERGEVDEAVTIPEEFPTGRAILSIVEPAPACEDGASCVAPEIELTIQAAG